MNQVSANPACSHCSITNYTKSCVGVFFSRLEVGLHCGGENSCNKRMMEVRRQQGPYRILVGNMVKC